MVNYVHSIEQVETVFDTGDKPLLVHCNDFNYYVTKYNTTGAASNSLFREYLNASFLQLWQLQTPAFAFVQLEEHHRPQSRRNIKHAIPCFGTLYNNELREVDAFISTLTPAQKKKFLHKTDLLKIALYDYWVANEDRQHNNYNLMLRMENDQYDFVPIDGGALFHTGNADKENYVLSYEETLVSSPLLQSLFTVKEICDQAMIANLQQTYYLCAESCNQSLHELINGIPEQWQINKEREYNNLQQFLFTKSWLQQVWETFLEHLQISIN